MRWALIDSKNKVSNIIEYDAREPYKPNEGFELRQVEDWVEIGDDADILKPESPPPLNESSVKVLRNNIYKNDLSLKYLYSNEKKTNPSLTFSDFLDNLEALVVE